MATRWACQSLYCQCLHSARRPPLALLPSIHPPRPTARPSQTCHPRQSFATGPTLCKNSKKSHVLPGPKSPKSANLRSAQTSAASGPLEDLQSRIDFLTTALKTSISKVRASSSTGSKHSVSSIENTKLDLKSARTTNSSNGNSGGSSTAHNSTVSTVRIADLAQVIQRGRNILLMISDESHTKPITSAIQALGLPSPVPVPGQKLHFTVPLPPPTAESRKEVADEAGKFEAVSAANLRTARGECKKALARLAKGNEILPDELREMEGKMEVLVRNGVGEFKSLVEGAKRAIVQQ